MQFWGLVVRTEPRHAAVPPARLGEGVRRASPDPVVPPPVGERGRRPGFSQHYHHALETLVRRQKPGHGVPAYMRWVNRPVARPLAAAAYAFGLTPNHVTALSALSSFAGLTVLILAPRTPATAIAVALLLAFGFVLDSADGQLARLRGSSGRLGEWVDHVVDAVRSPAIHLATAIALWQHEVQSGFLLVPLAFALIVTSSFFSQILAEQLTSDQPAQSRVPGPRRSWLLLPVDTGLICWVFILWGQPLLFALGYCLLAAAHLGYLLISLVRKYALLTGAVAAA